MRPLHRTALGIGVALGCVLIALVAAPYLFRDRIMDRLKLEINRSVAARVAWRSMDLGLLRDFPNVSLGVGGLSVVGVKPFDGDTLLAMPSGRIVLELGSVVRFLRRGDPIVVRRIVLQQPAVRLRVLADGRANWDIAKAPAGGGRDTARAVAVTLRELRISDGSIRMDDAHSRLVASANGLDEVLRGDFAQRRFVLTTRTRAGSVSARFAGVPYLDGVAVAVNADVDADLAAHRFTLKDNTVRLNNLTLAAAGSVVTGQPNVALDLTFSAPSTAFRDIVSLVPAIYAHDFADLQTSGTMAVSGRVRGAYGPQAFPALAVRARVDNGSFRYPSLPLPARDIAMELAIDNPGGHVDSTTLDIERLHAVVGGRPLDAKLRVRTPVSDPDVDLRLTGTLDLADVGRTIKLASVSQLAGRVAADVAMHARVSDVDAKRYDRVAASGTVNAARVALRSAAPSRVIAIDTAALRFTPRTAELSAFAARVGNTDVRATGSLDNVLGFVFRDQDLRGSAVTTSSRIDLDEWRSREKTSQVVPVPARVDFALKASADQVTFGALTLANVRGDVRIHHRRVTLDSLRMQTLRGTLVATGFYETVVADRPAFDVGLRLTGIDIPDAFATLTTVQRLAPIARWAQGSMSGSVALAGALGRDMTPVFSTLAGRGTMETQQLVIQGAPVLEKLASALSLAQLRKPVLGSARVSFDIADGRLHVQPFVVRTNGIAMTIGGSNGIDQSLQYDVALALGDKAPPLRARVGGTVTSPTVTANLGGMAASLAQAATDSVRQAGEARLQTAKRKADSAAAAAAVRARADADRLVAAAQHQADTIRAQARALAAGIRDEAGRHADSLVARAPNPLARAAAQAAADRFRREADRRAEQLTRAADARADSLIAQAKQRAPALAPPRP